MNNNNNYITEFVSEFIENYTQSVITDDVVSFYNDAFVLLQHFYTLEEINTETEEQYQLFINHIIKNDVHLKEYSNFNFKLINSLHALKNSDNFKNLAPIYTPYSFTETEETIEQILEELKVEKEFKKELKEEINYLLEEYRFHLDHIKENMLYNFYTYDVLENIDTIHLDEKIEELSLEKLKFIQKCNDKLAKK
ncbi:hypothetical protein P3875_01835 [Myroides sp. JBRI-B21084]|uniref:hypothetical protein n=1 Tax=Myroides sp. JBRI-B21084 TaxID=3119977 RepID=UPI0026E2D873|nr:hypothetical protein [Paenimyroides cloacae]WKW46838.1 hypothetical protein P3875_01835 [Paenimyroides cloacae]